MTDPKDREELRRQLEAIRIGYGKPAGESGQYKGQYNQSDWSMFATEELVDFFDAYTTRAVGEARLSQINKDRAVVLSYFTTGEQLKAFRLDAEGIRADTGEQ